MQHCELDIGQQKHEYFIICILSIGNSHDTAILFLWMLINNDQSLFCYSAIVNKHWSNGWNISNEEVVTGSYIPSKPDSWIWIKWVPFNYRLVKQCNSLIYINEKILNQTLCHDLPVTRSRMNCVDECSWWAWQTFHLAIAIVCVTICPADGWWPFNVLAIPVTCHTAWLVCHHITQAVFAVQAHHIFACQCIWAKSRNMAGIISL